MINTICKNFKCCQVFIYRCNSSLSDKDFFFKLGEDRIKTSAEKRPVNYLKFLENENSGYIDQTTGDNDKKYQIPREYINENKTKAKSVVMKDPVENDSQDSSDNKITTANSSSNTEFTTNVQLIEECVKEIDGKSNDLTIEILQKQIEDINLDELKNTPTTLLNIGPIINKHSTLTNFLKLGVDLYQIENKKDGANMLVRLDWERDVVPVMSFLKEQANFSDGNLAHIFSHFPRIFRKSLVDIQEIFNYFKCREIGSNDLVSIVIGNPLIMNYDRAAIEKKLVDFEVLLEIKTRDMNQIILAQPRVVTEQMFRLKNCLVQLRKLMGFTLAELQMMIIKTPKILMTSKEDLAANFLFLHRTLNMPYEDIVNCSVALATKPSSLEERVKYLIFLNKYQTDPTKELYTPISNIIQCSEADFCKNVAHTSMAQFRRYLKTL